MNDVIWIFRSFLDEVVHLDFLFYVLACAVCGPTRVGKGGIEEINQQNHNVSTRIYSLAEILRFPQN